MHLAHVNSLNSDTCTVLTFPHHMVMKERRGIKMCFEITRNKMELSFCNYAVRYSILYYDTPRVIFG